MSERMERQADLTAAWGEMSRRLAPRLEPRLLHACEGCGVEPGCDDPNQRRDEYEGEALREEVERLRGEVEHWKSHAEEAGRGFSRVCENYARVASRNSRLVVERDEAREKVRRVEAVRDEWRDQYGSGSINARVWGVQDLSVDLAVQKLTAALGGEQAGDGGMPT